MLTCWEKRGKKKHCEKSAGAYALFLAHGRSWTNIEFECANKSRPSNYEEDDLIVHFLASSFNAHGNKNWKTFCFKLIK